MKFSIEILQEYKDGKITLRELQKWRQDLEEAHKCGAISNQVYRTNLIEWSTDANERKFYYKCQKCGNPIRVCPDPACVEFGHHLFDEDWDKCDSDIPYNITTRVYRDENP
jgi:ferredoxin